MLTGAVPAAPAAPLAVQISDAPGTSGAAARAAAAQEGLGLDSTLLSPNACFVRAFRFGVFRIRERGALPLGTVVAQFTTPAPQESETESQDEDAEIGEAAVPQGWRAELSPPLSPPLPASGASESSGDLSGRGPRGPGGPGSPRRGELRSGQGAPLLRARVDRVAARAYGVVFLFCFLVAERC